MSDVPLYILHFDGINRFLLQSCKTGLLNGLMFPALPGESAHAFSYDYGSVSYPSELANLDQFPQLADMPFFTTESCAFYQIESYLKKEEARSIWPLLGFSGKITGFGEEVSPPMSLKFDDRPIDWHYRWENPNGSWTSPFFSLWVNEQGVWLSNREGEIIVLNHHGSLIQRHRLPQPAMALAGQEETPYASCNNGYLYDLSGKIPEAIYRPTIAPEYSYYYFISALLSTPKSWIIADAFGGVQAIDLDLNLLWTSSQPNHWTTCFLRQADQTLYQGHYSGVTAYDLTTGECHWERSFPAPVLSGVVLADRLIVSCSNGNLYTVPKSGAAPTLFYTTPPLNTVLPIPYTLALAKGTLWVGDHRGTLTALDEAGQIQTQFTLPAGGIMAIVPWEDALYVANSQGHCFKLNFALNL